MRARRLRRRHGCSARRPWVASSRRFAPPHRGYPARAMADETAAAFDALLDAMKIAIGVLQDADVPFLVAGGLALWARGGPRTEHDVDFLVKPDDAERALKAFED